MEGLRSTKDAIWFCLMKEGQSDFPKCVNAAMAVARIKAAVATPTVTFQNVAPGTYAVTAMHDESGTGDGEFNVAGLPKSGVGLSNVPTLGMMNLPTFEKGRFTVPETKTLSIKATTSSDDQHAFCRKAVAPLGGPRNFATQDPASGIARSETRRLWCCVPTRGLSALHDKPAKHFVDTSSTAPLSLANTRRLFQKQCGVVDPDRRINEVEGFLLKHLRPRPVEAELVRQLTAELVQGVGISVLRKRMNLSQRRLHDLFDRRVGIRPNRTIRSRLGAAQQFDLRTMCCCVT